MDTAEPTSNALEGSQDSPQSALMVLVGPMAAGKTSIGKRVAKELGVAFIDTDRSVVASHGPIPEIFSAHGESQFRQWEHEAVAEALSQRAVVSLGGGAVTELKNRKVLQSVPVVFLTVTPEAVGKRLRGSNRPLLNTQEDPLVAWERIFAERVEIYRLVSDVTFDTSALPITEIARAVTQWYQSFTPQFGGDKNEQELKGTEQHG